MHLEIDGLAVIPKLADFTPSEREQWLSELKLLSNLILPEAGTRKREVFFRNDAFELIVVQWGKNCETQIHSHGVSQCTFVVLEGSVIENIYHSDSLDLISSHEYTLGHCTSIQSQDISHSLSSQQGALTLHLYSKPLGTFNQFNSQTQSWDVHHGAKL